MEWPEASDFVVGIVDFAPLDLMLGYGLLGAIRLSIILMFVPFFTELALPVSIRLAGAFALSAPLLPSLLDGVGEIEITAWSWSLLAAKEMALGLLLVLIVGLPFWVVDLAGDVVETQRGLGHDSVTDPSDLFQSELTGRLWFLLFLLFALASGGLLLIMQLIYESYIAFPVLEMPNLGALTKTFIDGGLFEALFEFGLVIGLPAILLLFLADVTVALTTRFAQRMNVLQLALALKALILLVILPFYAPALIGVIEPYMIDMAERFRALLP